MATLRLYPKVFTSQYVQNASYASVLAATSATDTWNSLGGDNGQNFTGSVYQAWQAYAVIDTTPLANIGTITDAKFKTFNTTDASTTDFTSNIRKLDFSGSTPTTADWQTPAELAALPLMASYDTSGGFSGTIEFVTSDIINNINTAGDTKMVISSSRFESSTTPTGSESVNYLFPNFYLEVTYTPGPYNSSIVLTPPLPDDDGSITSSAYNDYASARAGSGLSVTTGVNSGYSFLGQGVDSFKGDSIYNCYQGFIRFDTSVLAGLTLTGATLQLHVPFDFSTTNFEVQARLHTWGSTLATGDFVAGASLSGKTLLATYNTSSLPGTTQPNVYITLTDVALLANLNTSGYTDIILVSKEQVDNSAPTGSEVIYLNRLNRGYHAKLTVTYNHVDPPEPPPAAAATGSTLLMMGIG